MNLPIKLMSTASVAMFLQTSIPSPAADLIGPIERLTLVGALVIAVRVLWVSNSRKDEQLIAMSSKVTETMALVLEAVKELRKATEEIGAAMDNLASNIAALPCSVNERETDRAERADQQRRHGIK